MSLTRDEAEQYAIALDRWRAGVLAAGASRLADAGLSATQAERRSRYFTEMADLLEGYRNGSISKVDFHVRRRNLRTESGPVYDETIMNDYAEPTPEELGITVGAES